MSVRFHESLCFDSTKDRLDWRDDFWGDSLDARWSAAVVGTGVAATVIDAQDGGIIRLSSGGTTGGSSDLRWGDIRSLHVNKKITIEARVRLNQTTQQYMYISLRYDTSNRIHFLHSPPGAPEAWDIITVDNASNTTLSSGITPDTNWHVYRIECFPAGEVHFYIDGVETANSPITTTIPDDAGDYLQPRFYVETREDDTKTMDIDYVYVRQLR